MLIIGIAIAVFILATVLTEIEQWGAATLTLVVSVVAMHYFDVVDVVAFLKDNVFTVGLYVLIYFSAGVVWSFVKWLSFLYRFRDEYREAKEEYNKKACVEDFHTWVANRGKWELRERPTAAKNRGRITAWISLWPFSMIGTFLNDPVRRLVNAIFRRFKGLYQRTADYVFRNDPELPKA